MKFWDNKKEKVYRKIQYDKDNFLKLVLRILILIID